MGSLIVRILGAAGAAALSVMIFGPGVASAWDPFTGKTYDEAAAAVSARDGTPVIGTVTGSQLETDNCIVTSWQVSRFLDTSGDNIRGRNFILNLNCNNDIARPGHPGNSAMSPQGAQAKKDQQTAASIDKNPAWCHTADQRLEYCEKICQRTGLCEI